MGHRMASLYCTALLGCLAWLWCQRYMQQWVGKKFGNSPAGAGKKQQQGPREKKEGWE